MKKIIIGVVVIVTLLVGMAMAKQRGKWMSRNFMNSSQGIIYVKSLPAEPLSNVEKNTILHMVEEEKLARDVYQKLYEAWKLPVFGNIAKSEQKHMNLVKSLVEKYNLPNSTINPPGKFNNPELQKLYEKLVNKGKKSVIEALIVGCTIEDLVWIKPLKMLIIRI
nr:DUF2202 domain-containing protein [Deferribacter autotrophicus]